MDMDLIIILLLVAFIIGLVMGLALARPTITRRF